MILNQILATILKRNIWRLVWRICLWILGLFKWFKQPFMALLSPSWRAESYPHFCNDLGVDKKMDTVCFLNIFPIAFVIMNYQVHYSLEVIHIMIARKPIYLGKCKFLLKKKLEILIHVCDQWYPIFVMNECWPIQVPKLTSHGS